MITVETETGETVNINVKPCIHKKPPMLLICALEVF